MNNDCQAVFMLWHVKCFRFYDKWFIDCNELWIGGILCFPQYCKIYSISFIKYAVLSLRKNENTTAVKSHAITFNILPLRTDNYILSFGNAACFLRWLLVSYFWCIIFISSKMIFLWHGWKTLACSAPSHYLNQCWVIVNWNLRSKL